MNIFDYFFNCFRFIIDILDTDFFGFGFSYLDFFLAISLTFVILRFLLQGFNESDRNNFFSISSVIRDVNYSRSMRNNERESQITTINNDLDRNTTSIVRSTRVYDKKGKLTGVINDKTSF